MNFFSLCLHYTFSEISSTHTEPPATAKLRDPNPRIAASSESPTCMRSSPWLALEMGSDGRSHSPPEECISFPVLNWLPPAAVPVVLGSPSVCYKLRRILDFSCSLSLRDQSRGPAILSPACPTKTFPLHPSGWLVYGCGPCHRLSTGSRQPMVGHVVFLRLQSTHTPHLFKTMPDFPNQVETRQSAVRELWSPSSWATGQLCSQVALLPWGLGFR